MQNARGILDGDTYRIMDGTRVVKSYTLAEAKADSKLKAAIKRNGWDDLPEGGA